MKISGVVAEYNPFHHGHAYHLKKCRELRNPDLLIGVMSGNFVQRGEPAIIDKWQRAKTAVENGCDIVFELPFAYCVQSAQYFAQGACDILKLAGAQDIIFGSEIDDIKTLKKLANIDSIQFKDLQKDGISANKAYELLYGVMNPNDILGLNYIRALKDSNMEVYSIKRTNAYHDQKLDSNFASATAIRQAIYEGKAIDDYCDMKNLNNTFQLKNYYPLIQHILFTTPVDELKTYFLMDEGIESLLIKQARKYMDFDEFLHACTTKRYSTSRIRRTLIHLMMASTKEKIDNLGPCSYLRILAYNKNGQAYLNELKKKVTIASRFNQIPQPWRDIELQACMCYAYPLSPIEKKTMLDCELQSPIFVPCSSL
ncbi:MAG: nucleotidyltransferase family protein [Erysipelotrichaceae bacterium]